MTGCDISDFFELVDQLPEVTRADNGRYWRVTVGDHTFGYLWEPTRTVGLKQTISEQLALVAERPETFEVQFTSSGFGWVVVKLDGVDRAELAELSFEAWRLTAPQGSSICAATSCRADQEEAGSAQGRPKLPSSAGGWGLAAGQAPNR